MTDRVFVKSGDWALASDGVQWILMRRSVEKRSNREPWRAVSFVRSEKDILARCMREKGVGADAARYLLEGLPNTFDEWKVAGAV
jgi:hypothetical protein